MLKKLTLQQQLIALVAMIAIATIAILLPVIDNNLTKVIDNEMYEVLDRSREDFYSYDFSPEYKESDRQIYHFTYDVSKDILYPSQKMSARQAQKFANIFSDQLFSMIKKDKKVAQGKEKDHSDTLYYKIVKMDDNVYVISLVYSEYSKELVNDFKTQVIYYLYGALALITIVLFIWVSSLIKPLKQIKAYIDDIRNDKEHDLMINRGDEIGVLSSSLVEMKQEIDRQNEIKEEMIHNISHDLKTPIAIIQSYAQSIKDDVYPYGDKNSSVDVILENSDRLEKKVRSLLYLNRLDYLSTQVGDDVCEMKPLIEHIVMQLENLHSDIVIEMDLEDVIFKGKDEHWRICIENIIENASRYVNKMIKVTLKEDYLEIYNDGDSLENNNPDALFQPYETGTKGQFGLGLSIVHKTVTMYGYQVKAVNKDNGVSFIIDKR